MMMNISSLHPHNFIGHTHTTHIFFVFREQHATEYEFDQIWLKRYLLFLLLFFYSAALFSAPNAQFITWGWKHAEETESIRP